MYFLQQASLLETVVESKLCNFQWTVDESCSGKTLVTSIITLWSTRMINSRITFCKHHKFWKVMMLCCLTKA